MSDHESSPLEIGEIYEYIGSRQGPLFSSPESSDINTTATRGDTLMFLRYCVWHSFGYSQFLHLNSNTIGWYLCSSAYIWSAVEKVAESP